MIEIEKEIRKVFRIEVPEDKHDCRESREVIDKLPLLEGDNYMSPPKYYMGNTYNVKCKICGNSWWQNYP